MAGIYISTTDAPTGKPLFATSPSPSVVPGAQSITSFDIGASNPVSAPSQGGSTSGKPSFSELTVTRSIDQASPILLKYLAAGTVLKDLKISVLANRDGGNPYISLGYIFTNVHVTSLQHAGSGTLSEVVTFSYSTIEIDYTPYTATGGPGTVVQVKWDLQANRLG